MDKVISILKREMKPSLGCTEPVAIGLAVSRTCEYLEKPATHLEVHMSSNIFKNAYSVMIPNAEKSGISLACVLGFLLSRPGNTMEIFSQITQDTVRKAEALVNEDFVTLHIIPSSQFYIEVYAVNETEKSHTITIDEHDNLVKAEKDGIVFIEKTPKIDASESNSDFDITQYTFADMIEWAEHVNIEKIMFLKEAVEMNLNIAKLGLEQKYAMGIGPTLTFLQEKRVLSDDLVTKVKRTVSAACDFRMSGGNGSVMTVLGSGNQGLETILPVAVVANELSFSEEKLIRAEMLSILLTIYMKYHVGRLSPICGATLAGAGASGAIAWMLGGKVKEVSGAVKNMLGCLAGMFCDGAKGGCSLKLATCAGEAVYSALYALEYCVIQSTDGFISEDVEETVKNLAKLSLEGMAKFDSSIIHIMENKK